MNADDMMLSNTVGDEDKLFIVNLFTDKITDPILIGQVKNLISNRFNELVALRQ